MLEKHVENYLKILVEQSGGYCLKFVSPGTRGVPDRIVLSPRGIFFVELKRPKGGRLSPHQKRWQKKFEDLGLKIHVLKNQEEVLTFVERYLT